MVLDYGEVEATYGGIGLGPERTTFEGARTARVNIPGVGVRKVAQPEPAWDPYIPTMVGAGIGAGAGVTGAQPAETVDEAIGAVPALAGAAGLSLPPWVLTLLGIAGAGYGAYQALGGGEGGGIGGFDILGGNGNGAYLPGTTIPLGGPGLAEPPARMVLKEWHLNLAGTRCQFYLLPRKRVAMYNTRSKTWKTWVIQTPAVIGKNMPSHKNLTRLRRNLKKHKDDANTILAIASPLTYARNKGYRLPYRRRR